MNVLVCIKRVPAAAGRITLTADNQEIDARFLGFTISPHEECAVEEAVRLIETHGGTSTVLTLGPEVAVEQLRDALALGIDRGVLLQTDGREWNPAATARAIADAVREGPQADRFDLLLFGNEAADTGDYQVGITVAHALGLPCVTGVKQLEVRDGTAIAGREAAGGWEIYRVPLPAVVTVKEGINLPRYPSVPGRLRARSKPIEQVEPRWGGGGLDKVRLIVPAGRKRETEILGRGQDAAARVVEVMRDLGVL